MHRKTRDIRWLFAGIGALCLLAWYVNTFSPVSTPTVSLFFVLLFLAVYFLVIYIFMSRRTALLVSTGVSLVLLLRLWDLRHPLYPALLVASLVSLELTGKKR